MQHDKTAGKMAISCYYKVNREGENYVENHTINYQVSGSLTLFDGKQEYTSQKGLLRLVRGNRLMKFIKSPGSKDPFQSLSIYLDTNFLKEFARNYPFPMNKDRTSDSVINLEKDSLLENYLQSVQEYVGQKALEDPLMVSAKLREGLLLILRCNPRVADVLFDFSEPYKIDLRAFMQDNYSFNVRMERLAYLTGRSLAGFKRDFQKEFGMSPGRWLTKTRLEEAYKLLSENKKAASDIYLDLGFENLSHFSFAFKKQFGVVPSKLNRHPTLQP